MFLVRATSQVARQSVGSNGCTTIAAAFSSASRSSAAPTSILRHVRRLQTPRGTGISRTFSTAAAAPSGQENKAKDNTIRTMLFDGEEEILTPEEKEEKDMLIKELKRRLSGPLADEEGNVPTGADRPTAIEVDGPSHFYANSQRYTAYTKLKHRLLTRMGYKVLHVPYFEWRKLRGAKEREDYMKAKLIEEPTEWLDPEDEKYYYSQQAARSDLAIPPAAVKAEATSASPPPPPPPPAAAASATKPSSSSPRAPPPPPAAKSTTTSAPPSTSAPTPPPPRGAAPSARGTPPPPPPPRR